LIIAARDIETSVEAIFNTPVMAVEFEPTGGVEAFRGQAGEQHYDL